MVSGRVGVPPAGLGVSPERSLILGKTRSGDLKSPNHKTAVCKPPLLGQTAKQSFAGQVRSQPDEVGNEGKQGAAVYKPPNQKTRSPRRPLLEAEGSVPVLIY